MATSISINAHGTGVFPGATITANDITIPFSSINSVDSMGFPDVSGNEYCFGLVDTIAGKLIAANLINGRATETQAAVGVSTVRKDYTFRFNLAHPFDELSANVLPS